MRIYIDESGTFTIPTAKPSSVSSVAGLVIPEVVHDEVLERFAQFKRDWGLPSGELKGRNLDEPQISDLIARLSRFDLVFEVTAIDMGMQTVDGLTAHRLSQAQKLTENLTPQHKLPLVQSIKDFRAQLERLSNQLYAQAVATFGLISHIIQKATLYYVQRLPRELGAFYWTIDAKEKKQVSNYDQLWSTLVLPFLQSKSFRNPLIQLAGADYSAFERFCHSEPAPPAYRRPAVGDRSPWEYVDVKKVLKEDFAFSFPSATPGLQLVDALTNAIRRAMNGNLQPDGWAGIGRLMVQSEGGNQVIQLIDLSGGNPPRVQGRAPAYVRVIQHIERTAKRMLV